MERSGVAVAPLASTGPGEGVAGPGGVPRSLLTRLLLFVIEAWRWTSPMRVPRCRFEPSCSIYARESINRYGAARGVWRAVRRIARCHPWNPGGVDPVD